MHYFHMDLRHIYMYETIDDIVHMSPYINIRVIFMRFFMNSCQTRQFFSQCYFFLVVKVKHFARRSDTFDMKMKFHINQKTTEATFVHQYLQIQI